MFVVFLIFFFETFFYDSHTKKNNFKKTVWNFHGKFKRERVSIVECNEKDLHDACAIILTFFLLLLNSP